MASGFFLIRWIKLLVKLYVDAFRYRLARRLFIIILIKFFILFAILKTFFFKDYLDSRFSTEQEKAQYVLNNLTNVSTSDTLLSTNKPKK